jgi:orotate phosphoribosyltransferase
MKTVKTLERLMAERLLALKAIKFQPTSPFLWGNGWESPIYCDDRKILSYPKERDFLKLEMSRVLAETFPSVDVIAGIATNAIAAGVLVAHQLSLPFIYAYPFPKDHGLENQIEGDLRPHQNVVIIENQVAIGDNCQKVIEAIRNNGCNVLGVVTLMDYELELGHQVLADANVPLVPLTNFSTLMDTAKELGYISPDTAKIVNTWHKDPDKWTKKHV